ncbi:SLC13 family permease [Macrococcoides canis]|uniref:SLC13 family permease n=1 Tax=Macrococcoides canis TaxID=1855823 RepID=UPI00105EFBC5|nr:SLC13 family permease [Macrococcus canis]TDM20369.1 SLC13 family permease [Macrococcus canis]TDM30687.1 SLC13 family permease [Macrococcus canis]TDM33576.1 SLC13 family permease [Macrococcus canis]
MRANISNQALIITISCLLFAIYVFTSTEFEYLGKVSVVLFVVSLIMFIATPLPAALVALLLLTLGVLIGLPKSLLFGSFEQDIIWLMIGAFIISGMLEKSGLMQRLSDWVLNQGHTRKMNRFIFSASQFISIVIPSTSSRAVMLLPLYEQLVKKLPQHKTYYSLLFPTLILMGSNLTLLGAGSHLIGMGLLEAQNKNTLSYFEFLLFGAPFGIVIGLISMFIIRLFTKVQHEQIEYEYIAQAQYSIIEKKALLIIIVTVVLWMTEWLHHMDIAVLTLFIALIIMLPSFNVMTFKEGLKYVNWSLILFVAAASALGSLLVKYNVVDEIQQSLFKSLSSMKWMNEFYMMLTIIIISVLSHLLITSHTTRAVVLIPGFLLLANLFQLNPTATVFLALIGMNYCLTFPVSSKSILVFYEADAGFTSKQLMTLSLILTPIYMVAMIIFYYCYWSPLGLTL